MKWRAGGRCLAALLVLLAWGPAAAAREECFYCGMWRDNFAHSWVEVRYPGKAAVGFCSLHCATIHLALHPEAVPEQILAADYPTGRLVDADKASWVIGGNRPGIMTARAKWAFSARSDALRFVGQHGGRIASLAEALKVSTEDMYRDISVIQRKRGAARRQTTNQNGE